MAFMTGSAMFMTGATLLGANSAMGFWNKDNKGKNFPFTLSKAEWKEKLSPQAYRVLREHGTEPAFSSPLDNEKRQGVFHCAGCGHALFLSAHKYDSGTGWPSFFQPASSEAIGTSTDFKLIYPRTEVHCANCGGHLGHVFDDGPQPTGKRYCMNGVAMTFAPSTGSTLEK
jgi:peptide-methionine (R)-S-oxide reductase